MKLLTLYACLVAFTAALMATLLLPEPEPMYRVKDFCRDHEDICSHSRLAKYHTPTPAKGMVVVIP